MTTPNSTPEEEAPVSSNPMHPEYVRELMVQTSQVPADELVETVTELSRMDYLTLCVVDAHRERLTVHEGRHLAQSRLILETTLTVVELARIVAEQSKRIAALEARLDYACIPVNSDTDDFMAGVEPVGYRCEKHGYWSKPGVPCYMCEPSVPALRTPTLPYYRNTYPGDPPLIFVRQAETVKPREVVPDPWTDGHDPETCQFPCPVHNPGSFYNVREIA